MEFAAELKACLREFAAEGAVEVRENGGRLAPLSRLSWEVRGSGEKPLLHLWSEQCNLTRRVLAITDHSDARLALAVERFGRSRPDRLEFIRVEFDRDSRVVSRESFGEYLKTFLAEKFPDEFLESLTVSADLEHSLSGNYARGLLRSGSAVTAVLAVPDGESADSVENSLAFGLLWLDRARNANHRGTVTGLRLIVPKNTGAALARRLSALDARLRIELFERDAASETLEHIDPRCETNLDIRLVPHRETEALLRRASAMVDPIVALGPRAISVHASVQSREVLLRFRGLRFARWEDDRLFFSVGDAREQELTAATRPALKRLLHELETHRYPLANGTRHSLFRAQPKRWLETLVREDVTRVDAALDARFVYSQVFADAGGEHGILDVLSVTRSGRLAILELKASEYIHLPLQAADYWLRVRRHATEGNLPRYGYFPGIELQNAPPLIYLVAPALRFHPATDILLRYLSADMQVTRIGVAESWRRGLRVVMRQ